MNLFGKLQGTNWMAPTLYILLALFFTAQLVIITALGTSFTRKSSATSQQESRTKATTFSVVNSGQRLPRLKNREQNAVLLKNRFTSSSPSPENNQKFPLLNNPTSWPPAENRPYPDLELYNQDGKLTRLSDLAGNVIIVQPVAMGCPLSQAYSGANQTGKTAFGLCFPTLGVKSFGEKMLESTGIGMDKPDLVYVQILLFNMQNKPPFLEDAKRWARHFDLRTSKNQYVLVATPEMSEKSKSLIPGFHLIDRSFHLRSDSAGLLPKRSLCNHFFPTLQTLFPRALVYRNENLH